MLKNLDGKGEGMGSVGNTIWSFHGRQLSGYTIQGSFVKNVHFCVCILSLFFDVAISRSILILAISFFLSL